jgi:hypothetical protein
MVRDIGLMSELLFKALQVKYKIMKRVRSGIINTLIEFENHIIINKRLKQVDLDKCIHVYRDNGILYLKLSLKGGEDYWEETFKKISRKIVKETKIIESEDYL